MSTIWHISTYSQQAQNVSTKHKTQLSTKRLLFVVVHSFVRVPYGKYIYIHTQQAQVSTIKPKSFVVAAVAAVVVVVVEQCSVVYIYITACNYVISIKTDYITQMTDCF